MLDALRPLRGRAGVRVNPLHAGGRARSALLCVVSAAVCAASPTAPLAQPTTRAGTPDATCFAVEQLAARERAIAESILLAASDGEALYTLAGGLKPVSSDFLSITVPLTPAPDPAAEDSLARVRTAAAALRCGPVEFHVQEFAQTYTRPDSSRYRVSSVYVVDRDALSRLIARRAPFWDSLGVHAATEPAQVLDAVERAPRAPRWRGYGYLFGYPDEAVDFFVHAGEMQDSTGVFVPRDFRRIETFRKFAARAGDPPSLSSFVYAVPKDAAETVADRALRDAAAPVYAEYRSRRAQFVTDAGEGIVTLWRAWRADRIGESSSVRLTPATDSALLAQRGPFTARAPPQPPSDPFTAPRPRMRAARAVEPLVIDGRLDESDWAHATPVSDFHIVRPDYAPDVTLATRVRVLFDDRHLYVGAEMMDPEARRDLRVRDLRREFDWSENDNFSITLGPLGDRRTAYQFVVTPYGSQRDVQGFDGGDAQNESWDGLWRVRTVVTDSGWTAEFAIPWETVRYAQDGTEWDINFLRNARRIFETSAWAAFPRQFSSFRITFAGVLEGIEPPPPRPSVRARPFVLTDVTQVGAAPRAVSPAAGGEVIWAPSANTSVDLTLRTDFAQADVDRQVVNLQRFSVFFPERRQFFLENADVLGVRALTGRYTVQPFFSRRIGLAEDGSPIPIDGGARFALRSARTTLGALAMRQAAQDGVGASNFGVLRGSRFLQGATRVGGMLAVRQDEPGTSGGGGTNVVTAVDALGRIGEQIQVNGMISTSHDAGRTGVAATYFAGRDTPALYTGILGAVVTRDYAPRTGFVSRPDVIVTSPAITGRWQPAWRPTDVVWFRPAIVTYFYNAPSDGTLQEGYVQAFVDVLKRNGSLWYPYVERHLQRPTEAFGLLPGVTIGAGAQDYWRYGWFGTTDRSARSVVTTNISTGGFFNGRRDQLLSTVRWTPTPFVAMSMDYEVNRLQQVGIADTSLTTHLVAPELRLAWSPRLQASTFYQYNTSARRGALNARLSWEFAPLSFVYVVYNDTRAILDAVTPADRSLIVKLVWFGQL